MNTPNIPYHLSFIMPRKCCTIWDGESCKTNFKATKTREVEKNTAFRFPLDKDEQKEWIRRLPNTLSSCLFDKNEMLSRNVVICSKHWPDGCQTKPIQGGAQRPIAPPSLFGITSKVYFMQTINGPKRNTRERLITAESRELEAKSRDQIVNWQGVIKYCKEFKNSFIVKTNEHEIKLLEISSEPPNVEFSLTVHDDYSVVAYRRHRKISIRDLIGGFSNRVSHYSNIDAIIERLKSTEKTTLFYTSVYVAKKEGFDCSTENLSNLPESEFPSLRPIAIFLCIF